MNVAPWLERCGWVNRPPVGKSMQANILAAKSAVQRWPCMLSWSRMQGHLVFLRSALQRDRRVGLDRDDLEARLEVWAASVLQATAPVAEPGREVVVLDGKTLRGSRTQGAPGAICSRRSVTGSG